MKTVIWIVVVVLVAVGGWYWWVSSHGESGMELQVSSAGSQGGGALMQPASTSSEQGGAQAAGQAGTQAQGGTSGGTSGGTAEIANPASVNCVKTLGGTLEIVDEANGQVGYCHLPDGKVCEEWSLFRDNTCVPPVTPVVAPSAPANEYVAGNLLLGKDGNQTLGTYLIGFNGMPVYTYANDAAGVSNCTGQCATNWPPYLVPDKSSLGNLQSGVTGTAGTITRSDGTLQVTYDGKPLYFYAKDTSTSGPSGQGVGGVWFVARP